MKKILLDQLQPEDTINLSDIPKESIIIAKKHGAAPSYVLVYEINSGYILRDMGGFGSYGHYETREECLKASANLGYSYFLVD